MRGRGNKSGIRKNQIINNKGYYTSPSTISILSRHFGIDGNLNITSTITTDALNAFSTIRTNDLNVISTIRTDTINTNKILLSTIILNNDTNIYSENNDLYISYEVSTSRVYANNIQVISTITNNLTFNTPNPIRMYANSDSKFVFTGVGSEQTFIVPSGVEFLNVKLWGAAGAGRGGAYGEPLGGRPGFVSGLLPVTPGQELTIIVGKMGNKFSLESGLGEGGFGGGGNGGYGGGGRSAITDGNYDIVTAGGGGGGGGGNIYALGGYGGNYSGSAGIVLHGNNSSGGGGTQESGGLGPISTEGPDFCGTDGSEFLGGDGAQCGGEYAVLSAGGGGGGYYGGGGGGGIGDTDEQSGGPGGGGSSYLEGLTNPNGISGGNYEKYLNDPDFKQYANLQNIVYPGLGDGLVVISYPTNLQIEYTDPLAKIGVSEAAKSKNGWIAGGAGESAGGNYNLQYSTDGLTWSPVEGDFPGPTNGIVYSGDKWVAVFSLSTINYIETGLTSSIQTSSDGIHWSQINSGGFSNGYGIAYGSTIWVATGQRDDVNSSIQISMDSLNWSNTSNSFLDIGYGVAYNNATNTFVAVGYSEDNESLTIKYASTNMLEWHDSVSGGFTPAPQEAYYNTYYANYNGLAVATNNAGDYLQVWVAVGSGTDPLDTIQYSTDSSNWTPIETGGFIGFGRGVAYGNGLWVATGDSTLLSTEPLQTIQWSTDAINWSNSVTGGFAFSGTSVAFNGKLWVATGIDTNQNSYIQTSTDGSNWSSVDSVTSLNNPNCVAPGVLELIQLNYTFLTNTEVKTNIVTANYVNSDSINGNYINASTINVGNYVTTEMATVSSLTAKYGTIGDFYTYSYVKNILVANTNQFVAIGTSKDKFNSIQWSTDGNDWNGVNSGGFSPTIIYGQTRITNSTEPKALLYNTTSTFFVAYGITDESRMSNDFTNTIQYSDSNDISAWYSYEGINTLTTYILENINNAMYTNDKYMLLTSIPENPILISDSMGEFYLGKALNNNVNFNDAYAEVYTSTLSAAYGFYKDTNGTYVVGTAHNSDTSGINAPIYYTTDGSQFNKPSEMQSNLPPTFYDITKDTVNNILFAVGPGVPNGTTSLSTLMYSSNDGVTWFDGGLEGVISARSVSYGNDTTNEVNNIVIACESTSSSNTIITYSYQTPFAPYVPNTLTDNVVTILYSTDNGSNWSKAVTGGFSNFGYNVVYNAASSTWYSVGSGVSTVIFSLDGSNWSNASGAFDIVGYGINKDSTTDEILITGADSNGNNLQYGNNENAWQVNTGALFDVQGYSVYYNPGTTTTVAVGEGLNSGTILYNSTDNKTSLSSNGITGAFDIAGYGVTYGNNLWVAVGKSSTTSNILYSQNGSNWSNSTFGPFDIEGRDVVYRDVPQSTLWVAVGKGITTSNILYSPDGSNWFNPPNATFSNIGYSVTWNGTKFVAVGDSGILLSSDGSNWSYPQSGNFSSQSTIGTGNVIINESYGRGVASGPDGLLVAVGRAESTNRQYNWSNIIYTPNITQGAVQGFSSVLSEDGNTIESTYVATKSVYDPTFGKFIVGGLTNEPLNAILSAEEVDVNQWIRSLNTNFDAVNEQQFINSVNASVVGDQITTNLLYASNTYISNSLTVDRNIYTKTLNTSNVSTSNLYSSNIYSSNISTNVHNANNINVGFISTGYISSGIIVASLINVDTLFFNNSLGNSTIVSNLTGTVGNITYLTTTNTTISDNLIASNASISTIEIQKSTHSSIETYHANVNTFAATSAYITNLSTNMLSSDLFTGDGSGLVNVTANALVDTGTTYSIPTTNIVANSITGNFTGTFTGTVNTTGPLSDDIINADTINVSTINTLGDIFLGYNGTRNGIINGNGSGLSNVVASSLVPTNNQVITANFTATNLTATGDVTAGGNVSGNNVVATNNVTANNTVYAVNVITQNAVNATGNITAANVISLGNMSALTIGAGTVTATTFYGDGSQLTGLTPPTSVNFANSANSANTANTAVYASRAGTSGFISDGPVTASNGSFRVTSQGVTRTLIDNNITCQGDIQGSVITASGGFVGDGSRLTGVGGGLYRAATQQGNVRDYPFRVDGARIPYGNNGNAVSIYKILFFTRNGNDSTHIAEVAVRAAASYSIIFLSDNIIGYEFNYDTLRTYGENALSQPNGDGIYFSLENNFYTLRYSGYANPGNEGLGGLIQQIA